MAVLPTPGSPMRTGLFFVRRQRIWMVAAELVEKRGVFLLLALLGRRDLQQGDGFLPDHGEAYAEALHHLRRRAVVALHQPQEDVLGSDVVLAQETGFLDGKLEDLLGPWGEGNLAQGENILRRRELGDELRFELLEVDAHVLQHRDGDAAPLAEYPEQKMLGAEVLVLVLLSFAPGEDDHPSCTLSEPLEHNMSPCCLV
jgi:hypothetical protein